MFELRDYQRDAVDALRAGHRAGHRRQILCAPTGAGKTVCAGAIIQEALAKNSRVKFIADRIALIDQTSLRLHEAGIDHGLLQGDRSYGRFSQVLVCSAQTLERRGFVEDTDLFIVDEAHTRRKKIIGMLEAAGKPVIGLTATPFTDGLGKFYTNIVNARTTDDLITDGWLAPLRVFAAKEINMDGAETNSMGEWSDRVVESRALPIVGDIVSEWVAHTHRIFGGPVKTLLFTPTIAFGDEICKQFVAAGYRFEQVTHVKGKANIPKFRAGELDGLVSCEALAKGFDVPDVLCVISARPYRKSLAAHIQQIGRGMRSSPGKKFCLLLDHGGNYLRFAEDTEAFWAKGCNSLDDGKPKERAKRNRPEPVDRKCHACGFVMSPGDDTCSNCGAERKRKPHGINVMAGQMREYRQGDGRAFGFDIWPHICVLAVERHGGDDERARKFAVAQYKNLTGQWPEWNRAVAPADECDIEVRCLVDAAIAKYVKSKRRGWWRSKNA